jgi:sugar phosphate isomerase/epimerase
MKTLRCLFLLPLAVLFVGAAAPVDFKQHLGIQMWSLRATSKDSVPAALDLVKGYGLTEIETAGTQNLTVPQYVEELRKRGLTVVASHMGYDALKKDLAGGIRDAKALGARYLIVPSLPHPNGFTEDDARRIAADFNTFGAACKAAGIQFGYHPHGFEFTPTKAGNGEVVFDVLARETKPDLVCFEMDVFWVFHAGQDPVKLLHKYRDRWVLMHVKDIRKGAVTGLSTGTAAPTDNVTVGTGQIDWPGVLRAGQQVGVKHYFIEDETPTPLQCIPDSLKYLRGLKL